MSRAEPKAGKGRRKLWFAVRVGLLGLAVGGLIYGARRFQWLERLNDAIAGLGPWGPLLFILAYVLACVLFVPGSVLTIGAGSVFGLVWGAVYASLGATLGATAAFLVGRHLARGWVARKIEGNETFQALDEALGREGWKIVGLARLSPVLPFVLLNYAFSLTRVRLPHYVLASWAGMLPGTILYVYLGSVLGNVAGPRQRRPAEWGLYVVGLCATVAVTVFVTRLARKALQDRIRPQPSSALAPDHDHASSTGSGPTVG